MEKYTTVIAIVGLVMIIALFILLRKTNRKNPNASKNISPKQAVLLVILAALTLAVIVLCIGSMTDSLWSIFAPI